MIGRGFSQGSVDIAITNPQVVGNKFSFEIHFTPTAPNGLKNPANPFSFNVLGPASWGVRWNQTALSNPTFSFVGSPWNNASIYTHTFFISGNKLWVDTQFNELGWALNGQPVLTNGVDNHIFTVTLDIDNPAQTSNIVWDQNNTAIFGNDGGFEVVETYQGNGDVTLPVELSAFSAEAAEGKVILSWATQSEVNNLGFEVYRAQEEAGNYTMIASYESNAALQGAGNSNEEIEYLYEDASIYPGATFWYQIADVDFAGVRTFHGPIQAEALEALPTAYALRNNYPNPFNPSTTIRFEVPANVNDRMEIVVYNALGMKLKTLVSGRVAAGVHEVVWDGTSQQGVQMASGVYFIRMAAGKFNQVRKMILLK